MKKKNIYLSIALFCSGMSLAIAEPYVGVSLGFAGSDFCDSVDTYYDCDGSGVGAKLFGGYKIAPRFGLEVASIGSAGMSISDSWNQVDLTISGLNMSGVYFHPVSDTVNLTAKAGMFLWEAEASIGSYSATVDGSDLSFGFGADFKVSDAFTLRAELDMFSLDGDSLTLLTAGAMWSF